MIDRQKTPISTGAARRRSSLVGSAAVVGTIVVGIMLAAAPAKAACDPVAGDNVTAVCTGATVDQGPGKGAGYGGGFDGLNVTVTAGASVTGQVSGIDLISGSVTNSGSIAGDVFGVHAYTVTIVNNGTIGSPTANAGVLALTAADVTNSGVITGGGWAINSNGAIVLSNSGSITADNVAVSGMASARVRNSGTIVGGFAGIAGGDAVIDNSGTIAGTYDLGIYGTNAVVSNSGTISGGTTGIVGDLTASVTNSGTIAGRWYGIVSNGTADITNSGTIIGGLGTAIWLNAGGVAASDRLTVLPGARFGGLVDFGGGADRVSFGPGSWILNVANFDAAQSTVTTAGSPYVVTPDRIVVADLSGFGAMNRAVMDITGWIASVLPETPGSGFAGRSADAYAAVAAPAPGLDPAGAALAYAPAPVFKGGAISDRDGNTVWAKGFGGRREQQTEGNFIGSVTTGYGGALGFERRLGPDVSLGTFVGSSSNATSLELNAGRIDTDAVFGGLYARSLFGASFVDLALIGGRLENTSSRNIGGGLGIETARAIYGGWFLNPSLALGHRFAFDGGISLTPALRLRYVAAHFDGYAETGSSANLGVGDRNVQGLEERAELILARTAVIGDSRLTVRASGGALAQQRTGDSAVNVILLGQNFIAATPDKANVTGLFGGGGVEWQFGRMALFASGEAVSMSDATKSFAGKGGLRAAW